MENASPDRRKHKRYAASNDAIAICDMKNGRIINISEGGMAVNFIFDKPFSEETKVTILSRTKNILIEDIPVRFVRKKDKPHSFTGGFQVQTIGVRFNCLNGAQQDQVNAYVSRLSRQS